MQRIARFGLLVLCAVGLGAQCGKSKDEKPKITRGDVRSDFIKAFFLTPIKSKTEFSGFWSVDKESLNKFVEEKYIKDYKPLPNELSVDKVRTNLQAARYFLRLDGLNCDAIFLIPDGEFTANAGELRQLEKTNNQVAYQAVFTHRDKSGKNFTRGAILTAFFGKRRLVLEYPDRKLIFYPESEKPAGLAEKYGKPVLNTGLVEY